jgi:DNA-binding transcriptional LysR family regulator
MAVMQLADRIGRRLKLRDLNILLAVAQAGSMAKAAEHLAVSQPVVSKAISELEATLGTRLFDRSRNGVEPTAGGRALLDRGVAVFDELRQGVREIEALNDPSVGEVRIAGTEPMVAGLLPVVIDRLCRRYPRLTVWVTQVYTTPDLYDGLRDRSVDFYVGRLLKQAIDDGLDAEVLFRDPPLVMAGADSPWAKRRKLKLGDLIDEPWILPRPDTTVGRVIAETFEAHGLEVPRATVIANSIHMNNALLGMGRFITMAPLSLAKFSPLRHGLTVLPVKTLTPGGPVGIVKLRNRSLSSTARLFIDCIREVAGSLPIGRS